MIAEPNDNTLDNAGETGRDLADSMSEKMISIIDQFPTRDTRQRVAIARIAAMNLDTYAEELER